MGSFKRSNRPRLHTQNLFFIFPTQAHPALSEYEQLQQRNIRQRKDVFDAMFQAKQDLTDTKSKRKAWNYIFSPVVILLSIIAAKHYRYV